MPPSRDSTGIHFRIRYALLALLAAIIFGTIGFHFIERWPLADSLYVTVQTLTTVGYGDQAPRSGVGRMFSVAGMLICAGGVSPALCTTPPTVWHAVRGAAFLPVRRRL